MNCEVEPIVVVRQMSKVSQPTRYVYLREEGLLL